MEQLQPIIRLEQVSRTFSSASGSVEALKPTDLAILPGEIFGIIGFSGAGKSTLVRCINLLERPTTGKVFVDGKELTALGERELRESRKKIGMIFQHFNLMQSRTVAQNVAFPLHGSGLSKAQVHEKVHSLLELVGLADKAGAYPSQLSGGQKQRVAIARALANDPKVLLCDEATSALDPQTTLSILALLREVNRRMGLTIVIITHEMAVIKEICHRVAVMEKGVVVEQGDVFRVFSAPRERVTRDFVDTTTTTQKVYRLMQEQSPVVQLKPGERLLKLRYLEDSACDAMISDISRRFGVDANIIFGSVEVVQDKPLGSLVVIMSGQKPDITAAVQFLCEHDVGVEVLDSASVTDIDA